MVLFTSQRERRLWIWTFVVVTGIYSTLGLASTLASVLYMQGVSAVAFLTSMLVVGAVILTQGLKTRPGGVEIGVALGVGVVYFMVFLRTTIPERSHLIEYGVVAVFIYEALSERASGGKRVPCCPLLAIALSSLLGVIDECIQALLPSREFEAVDILFNFLASLMAVVAMLVLGWARGRRERAKRSATNIR